PPPLTTPPRRASVPRPPATPAGLPAIRAATGRTAKMADETEGPTEGQGPLDAAAEAVDTIVATAETVVADAVEAVADIVAEVPAVEADAVSELQKLVESLGNRVEELAGKIAAAPVAAVQAAADETAETVADVATAPAETIIEAPVNSAAKGRPAPKRLWRLGK